jgi:hypothetical protein
MSVVRKIGEDYSPLLHLLRSCEIGNYEMVRLLVGMHRREREREREKEKEKERERCGL